MALESVTHISDLVVTNPTSTDPKSEGDNHLRNIKTALKTDFPNISGPVTKTHTQLNNALDKTGDTMTGPLAQVAGTVSLPSYTFSGDTDTGMWSPAAGVIAWSVNGAETIRTSSVGSQIATRMSVNGVPSANTIAAIYQGADMTLGTDYAVYIAGSGYAGGIALNATSMQIGQNSTGRSLTFHSGSGFAEAMRIAGSNGLVSISGTSGFSVARTAVTAPAAADGNVFSGTYTPTLTNTTNIASSTAAVCQYMRVGNVVTVSGSVTIDPTSTGRITLGMTIPVASNFSSSIQAGGTFSATGVTNVNVGAVSADATNDRFTFDGVAADLSSNLYHFTATYLVI